MLKSVFRWIMAVFFVVAGANHFISPSFYLGLMPPYLPRHLELIYVSGIAEMVLGVAVVLPRMRRIAGWSLIALLIAVFPANIHAALHGFQSVPGWILWARLPLQLVLIALVYWCCLREERQRES
jgi:uncharacterized membrane protein